MIGKQLCWKLVVSLVPVVPANENRFFSTAALPLQVIINMFLIRCLDRYEQVSEACYGG
jgi:hypothetical protein